MRFALLTASSSYSVPTDLRAAAIADTPRLHKTGSNLYHFAFKQVLIRRNTLHLK